MAKDFELKWNGDAFFDSAVAVSVQTMEKAAILVEADVVDSFGTGASRIGKENRKRRSKGKRGLFHRPSAPGFPPNVDTGLLRSSIGHEVISRSGVIDGFVGVASMVKYGLYLELGTKDKVLLPRPFLRPALARNHDKINNIFKRAFGD